MKNLKTLSTQEVQSINGGCQIGDCWPNPNPDYPNPNPGPIIFGPTTGPTFPDPDTILW